MKPGTRVNLRKIGLERMGRDVEIARHLLHCKYAQNGMHLVDKDISKYLAAFLCFEG